MTDGVRVHLLLREIVTQPPVSPRDTKRRESPQLRIAGTRHSPLLILGLAVRVLLGTTNKRETCRPFSNGFMNNSGVRLVARVEVTEARVSPLVRGANEHNPWL